MDGTCLAAGMVAAEGSFHGGEGARAEAGEDLVKLESGRFFQETVRSEERMC